VAELIEQRSRLAKRAWIRTIERRTLAAAVAIHVTSAREAAAIRELDLDRAPLVEVPNGLDMPTRPEQYLPAPAWEGVDRNRRVLYLGRISWEKGLDRLIAALPHAPLATLVLAGNDEGGYSGELAKLARRLQVADRVRFIGEVNEEAKW